MKWHLEPSARFWAHADIKGENDCWLWRQSRVDGWEPRFRISKKPSITKDIQRYAWELTYGLIPKGRRVITACSNTCINPTHLLLSLKFDQRLWQKMWTKQHLSERKEKVNNIKLSSGCKKCGYNSHAVALQFHHRNPKIKAFNIGNGARRASMPKVLAEIAKCDILCANCHLIEHNPQY